MTEKVTIPVEFAHLPDNERLIFKLIFSVSERSKNRAHQYRIAQAPGQGVLLSGRPVTAAESGSRLVVQVADRGAAASGAMLTRPLIATRVLSALDQLVTENRLLQQMQENREQQVAPDAATASREGQGSSAGLSDGAEQLVEFSISEEEASELAIVHDDTLANPANMEDATVKDDFLGEDASIKVKILPVNDRANMDVAPASAGNTARAPVQTALVVDDSASVRKQLEIELDLFEVNVDYAEDSERAMDLLSRKKYDVAFLDVVLPDGDGFQICKSIKSDQERRKTKVIMLTGKASHADKVRGSLAGCDAYMVKPVGRTTFQATVKKFLTPVENIEVMEA